ncbi:MAG: transporter substrate-binding domain-containing protein [Pseudomonadota bacterium]
MLRKSVLILFFILLCPFAQASETVQLATYYGYAPWHVAEDARAGWNAHLARKLTAMSGGRYRFESVFLPRKRLETLLRMGTVPMAVAWVHPRFFGDTGRTRFLWTGALMEDASLIVSPASAPLEYDGPASLRGKRFGAPAGHMFPDFEPWIASGEITRFTVPKLKTALLMMVWNHRLDFMIVDRSTLNALKAENFIDPSLLHIASKPRAPSYERRILVPRDKPELFEFLNKAVATLGTQEGWMVE